ncbi:MAG: hypothetical protein KDB92_03640 [Chitinophagaceae bacterium]|jgi:hypothetical protein|nr:hypothetical protein [Chitinophagaceae bacterium]
MPSFIPFLLVFLATPPDVIAFFFSLFSFKINFITMKNANHFFGSHNGSENFYRHNLSGLIYTDSVKELAEGCQAYWLINLIICHQCETQVRKESFQVWDLKRTQENVFSILATDGNHNRVTSQEIPFSDFPYDLATIWLVDGCLMLPSEY